MRRTITSFALSVLLIPAGIFVVGCDETVSEKSTEIKRTDGPDTKTQTKVTESPDGTMTKTEEKKVSP